jgi:hypothetical protein
VKAVAESDDQWPRSDDDPTALTSTLTADAGDPCAADGWFGPQTKAAVQGFQQGGSVVVDE